MPTSALGLALAAAVIHALWNVLLARARDVQAATAVALIVAEVVSLPLTIAVWRVDRAVIPFLIAGGALQLLYFVLLARGYRLAELTVVYPIARGTAPVIVLLIGALALGRSSSARQVLGVILVAAGVLLVRGARRGPGVPYGLLIACTIAGYTLVDKSGVRHAGAIPYLELEMLVPAVLYATAVARGKGIGALRNAWGWQSVVAGIASFGAYGLVLLALQRAPAAPVAAVRETSVVIAALLARRLLHEAVGLPRIAGSVAVAGGIVLLSI